MADFMEILKIEKCTWNILDFKEYDTQGTGHEFEATLAPPKWTANFVMRDLYNDAARRIATAVRKLNGAPVMIYDPSHRLPFADAGNQGIPENWVLAGGFWDNSGVWLRDVSTTTLDGWSTAVEVNSIGSDGQSLSIKGLPAGYQLTAGDKGQIVFAAGNRNYFFEISDDVAANSSGITVEFGVWPPLPVGISVDMPVVLVEPKCKMKIEQQGFAPGQSSGNMTFGTTVTLRERL